MTVSTGVDEEERVALRSETEESYDMESGGRSRMVVLSVAGLFLVASCATLFLTATSWKPKTIMARELLESPETVEIIANNVIALGHHHGLSKEALRDQIMSVAHTRAAELQSEKPEISRMRLSQEQKEAVLRRLKSMGDPHIHMMQNEIMVAIRETAEESKDHEALKRHLVEKLQPHMRHLLDAYFPHKSFTLQPKHFSNMRLVKDFDRQLAQLHAKKHAITDAPASTRRLTDDIEKTFTDAFDEMQKSFDEMTGSDPNAPACPTSESCDPMTCFDSAFNDKAELPTCFDSLTSGMPSLDSMFEDTS